MNETALLCADMVIFNELQMPVKVLMIFRKWAPYEGTWALPGGHLDPGETFKQAALREATEETGLCFSNAQQVGVYDTPNRDPRGRVISVAFTLTIPIEVQPIAGDDAAEVAWIPARDIISGKVPVAFDHQQIVHDAYQLGSYFVSLQEEAC